MNAEEALAVAPSNAAVQLGFTPKPPKQLPAGWELIEFARVVDPTDGRPWAKFVYSDGLELMFLVQAKPEFLHSLHTGSTSPPTTPESVVEMKIGLWTALSGKLQSREMVALGKVERSVLADLIQSSL